MSYPLESFVAEAAEAVARTPDPKLVVDAVGEALRRLLSGAPFLDEKYLRPSREALAPQLLHRDPKGRFEVLTCAWAPQQGTPIHDHPSWGIVAGVSNRIVQTSYRRLDDRTMAGYAELSEMSRLLVSEGSWAFLRPPEELIHRLENPFKDAAVTIHIFGLAPAAGGVGGAPDAQSVYDPRAKSIAPPEPGVESVRA